MNSTIEHIGINPGLAFPDPWKMQIAMLPCRRSKPVDEASAEKTKLRNEDLMAHNNALILGCLREHGALAVIEIVDITGLQRQTVSRRAKQLEAEGLIEFKNIRRLRRLVIKEKASGITQ